MIVTYVGKRPVQFVNDMGETISGKTIYCMFKDPNVTGFRTEHFYLKEDIPFPDDISVQETIEITFNMKGKPEAVKRITNRK